VNHQNKVTRQLQTRHSPIDLEVFPRPASAGMSPGGVSAPAAITITNYGAKAEQPAAGNNRHSNPSTPAYSAVRSGDRACGYGFDWLADIEGQRHASSGHPDSIFRTTTIAIPGAFIMPAEARPTDRGSRMIDVSTATIPWRGRVRGPTASLSSVATVQR